MLSESDIAALKDAHPLLDHVRVRVELKRASHGVWRGKCPFHTEDSPSFHVNDGECPVAERRHTYHCFGCGAHGDLFHWLKELHGMEFKEAVTHLTGGLPFQNGSSPAPAPRESVKVQMPAQRLSTERWARWEEACDRLLHDEAAVARIADWRGYSLEIVAAAARARLMGLWHYRGLLREAFLITAPEHCTEERDKGEGTSEKGHAPVPVSIHVRLAPHSPGNAEARQKWLYDPASSEAAPVKSWPFLWGNPVGARWLFITEGQWDALALADVCGWRSPEAMPPGCAIVGLRGSGGIRRFLEDFPFLPRATAICLSDHDRAGEQWHDEGGLLDSLHERVARVLCLRPQAPGCKDLNDLVKAGRFDGRAFLDYLRLRLQPEPVREKRGTFLKWCRERRNLEDATGRAARFVLQDKDRPKGRHRPAVWQAHWKRLDLPAGLLHDLQQALKAWSQPHQSTTNESL